MLTVKDIEAISRDRFYEKEGKYAYYLMTAAAIWVIIVMIIALISVFLITSDDPAKIVFTIPNSLIVAGQDINVMYKTFQGYTVNGFVLKTGEGNSVNPLVWVMLAMFAIPMLAAGIVQSISDCRKSKYVEVFFQKWVNKEIEL
jgi:hypothetical protein